MGGGICILSCEPPLLPPTLGHAALGGREGDVFIRGGRSLLPSHPPKETNSAVLSVAHCIAMSCDAVEQCPPAPPQDDEVVLQCTTTLLKEQLKLCLAAEGFGNRLCFLEPTSNAQVGGPLVSLWCPP